MTSDTHRDAATEATESSDTRLLLRHLHGELAAREVEALERRLAAEPALAAERARLEGLWGALELPPSPSPPLGFAARVAARARDEEARSAGKGFLAGLAPRSWATSPGVGAGVGAWAVGVLTAGLLLGVGLGTSLAPFESPTPSGPAVAETGLGEVGEAFAVAYSEEALPLELGGGSGSLAETYWAELEATDLEAAGLEAAGIEAAHPDAGETL